MSYYINDDKTTLDELKARIKDTDLIPSRAPLLNSIDEIFIALQKAGILTLADLRKETNSAKTISLLADKSKIELQYLSLLRREIEGYFPKPLPLKAFEWLPQIECKKIEAKGLKNSVLIYEGLNTANKRTDLSNELKIDIQFLNSLFNLVDLSRIQWVSPTFARMLLASGYENPETIAKANAEKLYNEVDQANKRNNFYKGKIGLRDIKRLIKAASYVL